MSITLRLVLWLAAGLAFSAGSVLAQDVCHDWDGDGELSGWTCVEATDCQDRSWWRRAGTTEVCDGLDSDCDGTLDQGCDRWCDTPILYPVLQVLPMDGEPRGNFPDSDLTDGGLYFVGEEFEGPLYNPTSMTVYSLGLNSAGKRLGSQWRLGEGSAHEALEQGHGIHAAGSIALAVWEEQRVPGDPNTWRLMARVVDRLGRPVAPAIDISASWAGGTVFSLGPPSIVWDGDRFVIFWQPWVQTGRDHELLMSVVEQDGTPGVPLTRLVTDDIDGLKSAIWHVEAIWTETHYLVAANLATPIGNPNLVTLPVDHDGVPLRDGLTLPHRAVDDGELILAGNQAAFSWVGMADVGGDVVQMIWLDLDGNPSPSGNIQLEYPPSRAPGRVFRAPLAWTGEMLVVGASAENSVGASEWWLWRVLPDGSLLDAEGVLIFDLPRTWALSKLHWAGEELWAVGRLKNPTEFVRARILCDCTDDDFDGHYSCVSDCDDDNWQAFPGASEICRGGVDEDCDGLIDCEDETCHVQAGPGEATSLMWAEGQWVWDQTPGAEVYDLSRGLISDFQRRGDFLQAECSGRDLATPHWTDDGRLPPDGDVLWVLVRAEGAPCATGSWGAASGGQSRSAIDCF